MGEKGLCLACGHDCGVNVNSVFIFSVLQTLPVKVILRECKETEDMNHHDFVV